ncbi:MAG: enoyl-CoA hydratase/isomerase family protein [Burkholderiales bacterium]
MAKGYESIELQVKDGVATIRFNLPQYGNALHLKGVQETLEALHQAEADENVGAVVLTGRGKAFCSGFNLKEIPADRDIDKMSAHFRVLALWWHQVLHLITRIRKPVLAAVNGVAAGSGLGMTLCADMAVCKSSARFLPAWHTIGLANDATTSYSLVKIVGFRRAMEWMMTNRTVSAEEALEMQLVNRVYDEASFDRNVESIAKQLADGPTHLQAMAKEGFHTGWRRSIEEATEFEIQNVMQSVKHPYFAESLKKFLAGERKSSEAQVTLPD